MLQSWQYNQAVIGQIVRRARTLIGVSIRELSARSGVSTSQILRVESGEFDIMLSTLLKICRCLGIPAGLVLEQGALPNPGFYAKLIGESGVSELLTASPAAQRPRNARARLTIFCAHISMAAASLLQSSYAAKLVQLIAFPLPELVHPFTIFADTIDRLTVEDRVSLQRTLDSDPLGVLMQHDLITSAIASKLIALEDHPSLRPDLFKLL